MRCKVCLKKLNDGAQVLPVFRFTLNSKVEDARVSTGFVHLNCVGVN